MYWITFWMGYICGMVLTFWMLEYDALCRWWDSVRRYYRAWWCQIRRTWNEGVAPPGFENMDYTRTESSRASGKQFAENVKKAGEESDIRLKGVAAKTRKEYFDKVRGNHGSEKT